MDADIVPTNLVPLAILSTIIFGKKEDELIEKLQELGVLRDSELNTNTLNARRRQFVRAISVNAHGKVEVERQFVNGLEKFSVSSKADKPLKLESLDKETFMLKEKDTKLNFQLRDVELYDVNNFVIKGMKTLSKDDWAKITFDLPETVKLICRYQIHGMVLGNNVHEGGTAEIKLADVQVQGRVRVNVTDEAIHILNLELTYSFSDLKIDKVSLIVAGMTKDTVNKLFSETGKKYLHENMPAIAERISIEIKDKLNESLKEISSAKILKSVKRKSIYRDPWIHDNTAME